MIGECIVGGEFRWLQSPCSHPHLMIYLWATPLTILTMGFLLPPSLGDWIGEGLHSEVAGRVTQADTLLPGLGWEGRAALPWDPPPLSFTPHVGQQQ